MRVLHLRYLGACALCCNVIDQSGARTVHVYITWHVLLGGMAAMLGQFAATQIAEWMNQGTQLSSIAMHSSGALTSVMPHIYMYMSHVHVRAPLQAQQGWSCSSPCTQLHASIVATKCSTDWTAMIHWWILW